MMLKAFRVFAMLLVLVGAASAGEMLNPPAPRPQPAGAAQGTADGVTLNGVTSTPDASESLTLTALELLAVLPSIF